MTSRRTGLWLVGAAGGVGTTATLGLAALARGLTDTTSLVTALPLFAGLDLDDFGSFVVGGHEIRKAGFRATAQELHERAGVFTTDLLAACAPQLKEWEQNLRAGTLLGAGATITRLADRPEAQADASPLAALARLQADLQSFQERHRLDQVVVVNVSSTEPPVDLGPVHGSIPALRGALASATPAGTPPVLTPSSLYAWAAFELGLPFVNFTPSVGANVPALEQLALDRKAVHCGKDGKTGETLMKSVLAPMFAHRNWKILSWVGHNIFGNRDGQVLDDPVNKASKVRTKDSVISGVVGYKPQTLVTIEYVESLDDWKTAWNHIHYQGFLGTKMILQFIWQGCDSLLAGPLVLDLARLALLARRRGEVGVLSHLACFFKSPLGTTEHDFFVQFRTLEEYVARAKASPHA